MKNVIDKFKASPLYVKVIVILGLPIIMGMVVVGAFLTVLFDFWYDFIKDKV
jgi:hypothetical protein